MKIFQQRSTVKNVSKIAVGSMAGQMITLIALPVLTRLFGPTVIGNWALILSLATIINTFSDLGLINRLMFVDDFKEESALIKTIWRSVILIALFSLLIVSLLVFLGWIDVNRNMLLFLFLYTIFQQFTQAVYTVLNRHKLYNTLMWNNIINNLAMSILSVFFYLLGFHNYGYALGCCLGQILTYLHMYRTFRTKVKYDSFQKEDFLKVLKTNFSFSSKQIPATILLQLKSQLPTLLISSFFGPKILGYYSLAYRIVNMPVSLIANSIGKVFFQETSSLSKQDSDKYKIGIYLNKVLTKGMILCSIPAFLLFSFSPVIVKIFFGSGYEITAIMLMPLSVYALYLFLSSATNGIAIVIDKQEFLILSGIVQVIAFSFSLFLGAYLNSPVLGVTFLAISFSVVQVVYFTQILRLLGIKGNKFLLTNIIILFVILVFGSLISVIL